MSPTRRQRGEGSVSEDTLRYAAIVAEVRDFATEVIAYESLHAAGPETPTLLAVARDVLALVGCPTCSWPSRETVGMVCQTCGTDYAAQSEDRAKEQRRRA